MQDTLMEHQGRIATLEGIAQETRETLRSIDSRINEVNSRLTSFMVVTIILWATTIVTIVGTAVGFFIGIK